jgi:hypothetical protein
MNWNVSQHHDFMGKEDPKVGRHKYDQLIAV